MKQKERQARSQQMILEAAEEEFALQGYAGFTVDSLCARHGISKGMLYHYYAGKDPLFLQCVERVFRSLEEALSHQAGEILRESPERAVREYFLARARYFQDNPQQKGIFETALFRPPCQLAEEIQRLHQPLDDLNHDFLRQITERLALRPGLQPEAVSRYFRSVEHVFMTLLEQYREGEGSMDVETMVQVSAELLDMLLVGIAQRDTAPPVA